MPTILHIETATNVCSVALSKNGLLLSVQETSFKNAHSSVLTIFIEDVLKSAGIKLVDIDAFAVSEGPGSYTGLRIGVATAKGLCYSLDKPLISVSTLQAMTAGMILASTEHRVPSTVHRTLFCPMIDARRMEIYCAIFDSNGVEIRETEALIVDENTFIDLSEENLIVIAGEGSAKCKPLLENRGNLLFIDDFQASAKYMISLAERKYSNNTFENIAYFEPFYLKDFIAGKPRVKGLH